LVQHDGEEIEQGFTINDFQLEDLANLGETNKKSCLKSDATFALLITIYPHTITMFNKLNNLLGLDAIFDGKPIGLGNCVNQQCGGNIGENNNREENRS
jgi:hypothetical protein